MKDLTKKIKNYSTACKHLKRTELTIEDFKHLPTTQQEKAFNRHVILTVIEALVGDWKPDFSDSEWKYEVYAYHSNGGFSFYCAYDDHYGCHAGSDFVLPSRELGNHVIEICKQNLLAIYN